MYDCSKNFQLFCYKKWDCRIVDLLEILTVYFCDPACNANANLSEFTEIIEEGILGLRLLGAGH